MLEQRVLPKDAPEQIIEIPTMRRWQTCLPNLLGSLAESLGDGADRAFVLIADGTPQSDAREVEARNRVIEALPPEMRRNTAVLSPESQASIVRQVSKQSGVDCEVVEAYLTWTGYGSQRAKLDMIARSYAGDGQRRVLSLDDDTTIPTQGRTLDPSVVCAGLQDAVNSQTILRDTPSPTAFRTFDNSIDGFFKHLGGSVSEHSLGSTDLQDTMHSALEDAQRSGKPVQFVVSATPTQQRPQAGRVVAAVATKSGVPDYRTVKIAEANLRDGFPEREVPFTSYPSGETQPFAFQRASTNVDSACIARLFDARTSQLGWWLITSDAISRANPLKTVTGHYRADNEKLPGLFERVQQQTGESLWYVGGIDTQVLHHRARSGYRPDIIEQCTASLVGNLVARAALEHLSVDRATFRTTLRPVPPHYQVPEDWTIGVFQNLQYLAECARDAIRAIDNESMGAVAAAGGSHAARRERYAGVFGTLYAKTAGFDYDSFALHANAEIRNQLAFYGAILDAAPRIESVTRELIAAERYPALRAS